MPLALLAAALAAALAGERPPRESRPPGSFKSMDRDVPWLLAAPHGDFDRFTGDIAEAVCAATGWDCLVARGFRTRARPLNVNRPTEGLSRKSEKKTERAAALYEEYLSKLRALNEAPALYVELHGNSADSNVGLIEVAAVGISTAAAAALKVRLNEGLAAAGLDGLECRVEGADRIRYSASSAKESGSLSALSPALHVELPLEPRRDRRAALIRFLSRTLPDLPALVRPPDR